MRCRVWLAAVAAAVVTAGPALAVGEFTSGRWIGKAYYKSADFTHCAMLMTQGDWKLLFEITSKGAVRLGVSHKQLAFRKNQSKRGVLQVDDGAPVARNFVAALPQLVVASAGTRAQAESLVGGRDLKVRIGDLATDFSLAGAKEAFAQLAGCAAARGNNGGTSATLPVVIKRRKVRARLW
jgi:hypothetical protein